MTDSLADSRDRLDLENFAPYLVNVLARRMSLDLARVYQSRFGIGIAEWRVLAHLHGHAKVSVRDIHARVSMDRVKVSRAASRLEAAGYVDKAIAPSDQRLVELQLTERGRALFADIAPLALAYQEDTLARLTKREREAFLAAIRKLLAPQAEARNRGAA